MFKLHENSDAKNWYIHTRMVNWSAPCPRHDNIYGGKGIAPFLTLTTLTIGNEPSAHWIGSREGPRASVDILEKREKYLATTKNSPMCDVSSREASL
jgi:hypothetical protein